MSSLEDKLAERPPILTRLQRMREVLAASIADVRAAIRLRHLWIALASDDIGDQHRRTTLGPFWLLINYLALLAVFVFLFERGGGLEHYAVYAGTGLLVWMFIGEVIGGGVSLFVRHEGFIKGTRLPLSLYVLRLTMQALIRTSYAAIGCAIVLAVSGMMPTAAWLWVLPGLLLILLSAPPVIIAFGFLGAYFPDSQFIVSNLIRIGMFVTPIFWWNPGGKALRAVAYHLNPFTYYLELVRGPIFSDSAPLFAIGLCSAVCIALWLVALPMLGRFRRQLVFVL